MNREHDIEPLVRMVKDLVDFLSDQCECGNEYLIGVKHTIEHLVSSYLMIEFGRSATDGDTVGSYLKLKTDGTTLSAGQIRYRINRYINSSDFDET